MKSPEAVVLYLAERIGRLYHHPPLMYGGTPEGVDLLLLTLHQVWAEVVDRRADFNNAMSQASSEADCVAMGFPRRYLLDHPDAAEEMVAAFVTEKWRIVSDRLGVPIDHAALERESTERRKGSSPTAPDE